MWHNIGKLCAKMVVDSSGRETSWMVSNLGEMRGPGTTSEIEVTEVEEVEGLATTPEEGVEAEVVVATKVEMIGEGIMIESMVEGSKTPIKREGMMEIGGMAEMICSRGRSGILTPLM